MPRHHLDAVAAGVSGAAQGLAVYRQHPAPPGRGHPGAQSLHERADRCVEPVGVDLPEQASDGRLRRALPSVPSTAATSSGTSATHPATATNDRAPAATAHTATVS